MSEDCNCYHTSGLHDRFVSISEENERLRAALQRIVRQACPFGCDDYCLYECGHVGNVVDTKRGTAVDALNAFERKVKE